MPDIKNEIVQLGEALVLNAANEDFKKLAAALQTDRGVALTIEQSYMSAYDIVNEIRLLVKDKTEKPPSYVKPLLTPDKTMSDIVADRDYPVLVGYLDGLTSSDFEPPLPSDFTSVSGVLVKQFPNKMNDDPRRTGRLIVPGPIETLKSIEVQKWLVNNSVLYGYIPYSNNGLYYVGLDMIRAVVNKEVDKQAGLVKLINTFVQNNMNQISVTYNQILTNNTGDNPNTNNNNISNLNTPTGSLNVSKVSELEYITNNKTLSNDRKVLDLVVIDNVPVWKGIAEPYLNMYDAAKTDGVTLIISSGFRPAYGANQTLKTNKGYSVSITTQESIRRDKAHFLWVGRSSFKGTDEEFVFNAPSNAYKPPVGKPGLSKHGDGIAIDLNTGGRDDHQPLQPTVYKWLIKNSYKYGFVRTVGSEEWHFEYHPELAKNGPYAKLPSADNGSKFYTDLGLSKGLFQV